MDMEATKDGRLSSFFLLNPFGGDSDEEKNPVMITQFLKKCTAKVIGNVIRMPFIG